MNINENHSLKDLERLKRKIEKQILAKKSTKEDQSALYEMIKKDQRNIVEMMVGKCFVGGRLSGVLCEWTASSCQS